MTHKKSRLRQQAAPNGDVNIIVKALRTILVPGQVTEVRALDAKTHDYYRPHVVSGYFDDFEKLVEAVSTIQCAKGVYFIPNPVNPALLARAANHVRPAGRGEQTGDGDIVRRRWLLIDCDPVRPSGISSTDVEHEAALDRVRNISKWLQKRGWPGPVVADSGNGHHLLYRIDLPADDGGVIQRCLEALADHFDNEMVTIDRKVYNPARIWKLYGTSARKGDHTPERPHRMSKVMWTPESVDVVTTDQLEGLAALVQSQGTSQNRPKNQRDSGLFSLEKWISTHNLDVVGPEDWSDKTGQFGRRWVFTTCPWNSDHTDRSAYIVQFSDGAIAAGCHHNGCAGKDWHALRDVLEPGWRDQNQQASGSFGSGVPKHYDDWPVPQPLPDGLPPVAPFNFELLPRMIGPWIKDIALRVQCPPDFPAVAVMVALAGVVGRRVGIRPKRYDDWLVVPNLWGSVIGRPGVLKSPALQEALKPLKRLEIEAKEKFDAEIKEHQAATLVAAAKAKDASTKLAKAVRDGGKGNAKAVKIARGMIADEEDEPVRLRFLINDSTVEKLGVILAQNPFGITVYRDELIGLLHSLDKEGQEGARAFYLEAWNGNGRYTYDRISRGTIDIETAIVSIIGGIQPGPLSTYLRDAVHSGKCDDGLLQRFQMTVWPDLSGEWVNVDQWPDTVAKNMAFDVFAKLSELDAKSIGASRDNDDPKEIPYIRYCDDAQRVFDEWRAELEKKIRTGEEHPAIESHLAKFRSLIPTLALLIHLADGGIGRVGTKPLQQAILWGPYLETHARRIYAVAVNPDIAAAKALASKILGGKLPDGFAAKDVYRPGWTGLSSRDEAVQAVSVLVDLDWLVDTREPTAGRPRTRYWINPKIHETATPPTAKSAQRGFRKFWQ